MSLPLNCDHAQADLPAYLSGQLSVAGQAALLAHLAGCADCRQALQATERTWQALGQAAAPAPSPNLRPAFYAMLADYKATLEAGVEATPAEPVATRPAYSLPSPLPGLRRWWQGLAAPLPMPQLARLAYSLSLLAVGALGGYWLTTYHQPRPVPPAAVAVANQPQVAALAAQVGELRQVLLLSLIENPSATERLRAVGYTKELRGLGGPSARVVTALLRTLDHDPNVNVRLAALEALAPLAPDPAVRLGLVRALSRQGSPLVQSALADVMVQLQERRSVAPLRELLRQTDLNELVKSKIERSIQALSGGPPAAPTPSSPPSTPARHDQTHAFPRPDRPAFLTV